MVSGIHKDVVSLSFFSGTRQNVARCRMFRKCSLQNIYEGIRRTMKGEAAFIGVNKNVAINLKCDYCPLTNMYSELMIRIPNFRKTSSHPAKIMIRLTIVLVLFNALK